MTRALEGLTVLALEQATTLPFLTYRLACDGARVVAPAHRAVLGGPRGFAALPRDPDAPPAPCGAPVVERAAAEPACGGVMTAPARRGRGGEGARSDVAM